MGWAPHIPLIGIECYVGRSLRTIDEAAFIAITEGIPRNPPTKAQPAICFRSPVTFICPITYYLD